MLCIISVVTIIVKVVLYMYTRHVNKSLNNILIEANSKDHRNDCLVALLNLVSSLFEYFGIYKIDGFFGIIISLWILI